MLKYVLIFCFLFTNYVSGEGQMLAICGSLRQGSYNKLLAKEAAAIADQIGVSSIAIVDLKDYPIPFYDGDLEADQGMPEKARQLRKMMIQSDIIVIASPEYNGSLSAVLKNALDWASRSEQGGSSREAFNGKTFVIMSAAAGASGGARGLSHLKAIIEAIGGDVWQQTLAVGKAYAAFDAEGHLKDQAVYNELKLLLQAACDPIF